MSDKLISALGIIILDAGEGLWRLKWDSPDTIRESEKREGL